eukprot:70895-Hanusia_phi.AAC.1
MGGMGRGQEARSSPADVSEALWFRDVRANSGKEERVNERTKRIRARLTRSRRSVFASQCTHSAFSGCHHRPRAQSVDAAGVPGDPCRQQAVLASRGHAGERLLRPRQQRGGLH